MDSASDNGRSLEFDEEHTKRDRRISEQQRRQWADGLISSLPDSQSYRAACTPQARLKEQALLIQIIEQCKTNPLPECQS